MIRKAIIVVLTVLAATVLAVYGSIVFGSVAWCPQPNDTHMGAFIVGDSRFLDIGLVRIVREYVKPETVENLSPQQFKEKLIINLPGLWVTYEDEVWFFQTGRVSHSKGWGPRCTVYRGVMHRGDALRRITLVVNRHWLWGSAIGLAVYPTIAFFRGSLRRWRRRRKGLCVS